MIKEEKNQFKNETKMETLCPIKIIKHNNIK